MKKRKVTKLIIRLLLLTILCFLISLIAKIVIGTLIPDVIFELKYWWRFNNSSMKSLSLIFPLFHSFHLQKSQKERLEIQRNSIKNEKSCKNCFLTKTPMIQYVGNMKLMIGWESNYPLPLPLQMHIKIIRAPARGAKGEITTEKRNNGKIEKEKVIFINDYKSLDDMHYYYRVMLTEPFSAGKRLEYSIKSESKILYSNSFKLLEEYSINSNNNQTFNGNHIHHRHLVNPIANDMKIQIGIIGNTLNGKTVTCGLYRNIKDHKPDLLIHLGNMVNNIDSPKDWQRYYDCASTSIPMLITMGNHDLNQELKRSIYISEHQQYSRQEALISSESPSLSLPLSPPWFAITIANTRWIILDSNESEDEQIKWLDQELGHLQSQKALFRIVLIHVPPFYLSHFSNSHSNPHSSSSLPLDKSNNFQFPSLFNHLPLDGEENYNDNQREELPLFSTNRLVPIFEKFRVNLVLCSHQNNYQRGFRNGVYYLISGGGGNSSEGGNHHIDDNNKKIMTDPKVYTKVINKHHYIIMNINEEEIVINVMDINERNLDQLKIPKAITRKFKPSEII